MLHNEQGPSICGWLFLFITLKIKVIATIFLEKDSRYKNVRYVISIIMGIVLAIWSFKQLSQSHLDSGFMFFFIVYVLYISYFNSDKHYKIKNDSSSMIH